MTARTTPTEETNARPMERPWGPRNPQWWSARILCLSLLALALGGYGFYRNRSNVVRTQLLEIVNAEGKVCGAFGATIKGNPELALHDNAGKRRASFTVWDGGTPSMTFYDADGAARSSFDVTPGGKSVVRLSGKNGNVRMALEVAEDGSSVVRLSDKNGIGVAALTVREDGTPEIRTQNWAARNAGQERSRADKPAAYVPAAPQKHEVSGRARKPLTTVSVLPVSSTDKEISLDAENIAAE